MNKPNYKLVDGEPVCSLEACFYYLNYYSEQNPLYKPGKIHICQASGFESVTKHILCIPGLREQRDAARLELCTSIGTECDYTPETVAWEHGWSYLYPGMPVIDDVCTNCNGAGSLSQYDFYNGVHVEECPVCNGIIPKFVEDKFLGMPPDTNDEGF